MSPVAVAAVDGEEGAEAIAGAVAGPRWSAVAHRHGVGGAPARRALQVVQAVVDVAAAEGRPLTVAVVTGPWGSRSDPAVRSDDGIAVGVAPDLHLVLVEAPGPSSLVALRRDRAEVLASSPSTMVRIGIAWATGPSGPTGHRVLEVACESLAAAARRAEGIGPLLGVGAPPR